MTKSKKKIIFLTTTLILTICLMGFMGVYALTILKNSQINVGISYQPEYLVKVEMGIDGANGGTDNQTIEENEYVEIFNSLNPVSNGMYIQSMSNDTIHINSQTLTPIGVNGDVYFRITSLENETSGNKDLQCIIDCGSSTADSKKIVSNETKILTISTGLDSTSGQPASSSLGMIKINLNFQEYEPLLTELIFEVPALNVFEGSSYNDVISKINGLNIIGKYDDDSQKNLILNTDYELNFNRTDGGGNGNFTQPGIAGTITAIAISDNEIQKTINLNVQPYTVYEYASETGPVYDNSNTSNRYVHYIEMGEYPQRYVGTTSTISATPQGTYYVDNNDGSKKYALKGNNYYLVEPVRWIVIGVTDGVYDGGEHVLFTTGFQAENESSSSGLWLYNEKTNTFKYRKTTSGEWKNASEVLVLSEYSLLHSTYKNTGYDSSPYYNHFSASDINEVLNDEDNANSLYNTMFTDNQRTKIIPKTMEITSYYNGTEFAGLNSTNYNTTSYNMFLLGSNINYNGSFYLDYATDSYSLGTYFKPSTNTTESNRLAKETAYSSGTQDSPGSYSASYWCLRSGNVCYDSEAFLVGSTGDVTEYRVFDSFALRPAFVLDIT